MSNLPTTAKIAAIPAAAMGLLTLRYMIGHTFTVMLWVAVIAGIIAVASAAKAKRKPAPAMPVERNAEEIVTSWAPPTVGLPRGTSSDPIDVAYQRLMAEARSR
jgi:hypothetical protein